MECAMTEEFQGIVFGCFDFYFVLVFFFFHSFTLRQLSKHFKTAPE